MSNLSEPLQKLLNKRIIVPIITLPKPDTPELESIQNYFINRSRQKAKIRQYHQHALKREATPYV